VMQAVGIGSISSRGQMVSNMSTSSSLLAGVDQELAYCRYRGCLLLPLQSSSLTQSASSGLGSSDGRSSCVYVKE
jgi:hypothetical protein